MFSKIFLSKSNLLSNLKYIESVGGKKICVMIKANAYGHGDREIVSMLDGRVEYFGVSNQSEGIRARERTSCNVLVFGKCENYLECMKNNLSFALFSYDEAKTILKIGEQGGYKPKFHLCLNSGMNRYGFKKEEEILKTIDLLESKNLQLQGFYTHFSCLTSDVEYTKRQEEIYLKAKSLLPKAWDTICHVGGGKTIYKHIEGDMYRTGLEIYGYGNENLKAVMSVSSEIVDLQNVAKGEHVGYLCGFTAQEDMRVATIPLGYGDGLPRKLSNKLEVLINGQRARVCGNICMDAFMVDVSALSCQIGDRVEILTDARELAPLIESTEYEVLVNFGKFRGERIIV